MKPAAIACCLAAGSLAGPMLPQLHAQEDSVRAVSDSTVILTDVPAPVIDTIVILRKQVFTEEEATNGIFRFMNKAHILTRPWVIQQDVRFSVGEAYDSALVAETERLLLERQIFRSVSIDTVRFGSKLGVVVETQDAWTLKPKFAFAAGADGTVTYTLGLDVTSLFGTGNRAYGAYKKEVDREGWNLTADFRRVFGTDIDIVGNYAPMSDGKNGNWGVGAPFRYVESKRALAYVGSSADQRVFRYARDSDGTLDSTVFRHESFINNVGVGWAPRVTSNSYFRIAAAAGVRVQSYVRQLDVDLPVDDSIFGTVGGLAAYRSGRFMETRHFNGFGQEAIDLSPEVYASLTLAPKAFGYRRTGVGPGVGASGSKTWPSSWIWASLRANGVFDSSGLDSGRVVANLAFGTKMAERLATGLQIQGAALERTAPGSEFDLGFQNVLRSWAPHSFVGTRTIWGTFEQRWYVWDKLANLVGIGFAAFIDYGGAWYENNDSRFGGDAGVGIRIGSALSAIPRTSKLDIGYRFGDGVEGSPWAVSFGAAFVFPWRQIPVTCYRAAPPDVTDCRPADYFAGARP
jgi:hypothetical protein